MATGYIETYATVRVLEIRSRRSWRSPFKRVPQVCLQITRPVYQGSPVWLEVEDTLDITIHTEVRGGV